MKQLTIIILLAIQFASCGDKSRKDTYTQTSNDSTNSANFSDSGESSFQLIKYDGETGYQYKSTEVNYKTVNINPFHTADAEYFIAKYTSSTSAATSKENQDKTIEVELRSMKTPDKTALKIKQDCDDLFLEQDYYKTVKYGCCGAEDQIKLYNYENKLIIEGTAQIIKGSIPNAGLDFYVAYKPSQDTSYLGAIYYSYRGSERYEIKIKADSSVSKNCGNFSPNISIYSANSKDKFLKNNNEYELWSLDGTKSKDQINNISLKVLFECADERQFNAIVIPITNGKPFGKDDKVQEYIYK
ncbi:MAG: hypothetical protein WBP45_15840 [Daejeonella sp.]